MIAHDFSSRLTTFNRWRRQIYTRGYGFGFAHGFGAAVVIGAFFAYYLWIGLNTP